MIYIGGGPYHAMVCPDCEAVMWNGRRENLGYSYHWSPMENEERLI